MAYTINRHLANLLTNTGVLDTGKIPADYITNDHIADNTIATSQLHSTFTIGAGHIPANTVTISHLAVTDGSAGQVLKTDGSGNLSFTTISADKITEGNTFVETIDTGSNGQILFVTENTQRWQINNAGHLLPISNNSFDIGSATHKVRDLYVDDNSIHIGSNTKLSINADGDFQVTDENNVPKKLKVDELEIGTGDDRVILKKSASGDLEQQRKISGVKQTATKPFLIGVHNSGDITEGGSNKFYTDARVQSYLTSQGIVNQSAVIAAITDSAPSTLDTLNELAAAIGDDANFSTTITNSIATKLPLAGGTLTGNLTTGGSLISTNAIVSNITAKTAGNITVKNNAGLSIARFADNKDVDFFGNVGVTGTVIASTAGSSFKAPLYIAAQNSTGEGGEITLNGSDGNTSHTLDTVNGTFRIFDSSGTFITGNSGYGLNVISNIRQNGNIVIDTNRNFIANSRLTFGYNSHYFEAGTNSVAFKNSGGSAYITITNGSTTINSATLNIGTAASGNLILKRPNANYIAADQSAGYFIFITNGRATTYANRALALTTDNDANVGRDVNAVRHVHAGSDINAVGNYKVNNTNVITSARRVQNVTLGYGASGARLQRDGWHYDDGGTGRFYFEAGGRTFYKSMSGHQFRNSADLTDFNISNDGHLHIASNGDSQASSTEYIKVAGTPILTSSRVLQNVSGNVSMFTNDSNYATQSYVTTAISNLVDSAPSALDTLNELAAALGDDANFSTTITNSIATKAPLASPNFTGTPTVGGNTVLTSNAGLNANNINAGTINQGRLPTNLGSLRDLSGVNAILRFQETDVTNTPQWWLVADGGNFSVRLNNAGQYPIQVVTNGSNNAVSSVALGYNTTVNGNISAITGNTTGKFAVKSTAVHNSYDFYNNGTSYFNGSVIVDDALDITGTNRALKIAGTTRINSVGDFIGTSYYVGGTNVIDTSGNWVGPAVNAGTLDSLDSTKFTYYRGVVSGDWDTIFTTASNQLQTSGLYQINNTASGSHSNFPVASGAMLAPYSYGGVFAWNLANHTFKLYAPHVGNLYYQSGWNNDEYSGWRMLIDSSNYGSAGLWASHNDGSGSGLDADLLDGVQGSSYLRSDVADTASGALTLTNSGNTFRGHLFFSEHSTGRHYIHFKTNHSTNQVDWRIQTGGVNSVIHSWTNTNAYFATQVQTATQGILWGASNDGSGSGLDADLLDGQQGSYYLDYNNLTNKPSASSINTGSSNIFTATQYFRKNNVTNYTDAQLITESYGGASTTAGIGFHISGSIGRYLYMNNVGDLYWNSSGAKIWRADNDGSGSGLDADTLDGQHASSFMASSGMSTSADTYINARVIRNIGSSAGSDGMYIGYGNAGSGHTRIYGGGSTSAYISNTGSQLTFTNLTLGAVSTSGAFTITNNSIRSNSTSTWDGNPGAQGKIQYHANRWYIVSDSSSNRIVQFRRDGGDVSYIANSGNFVGNVTGNADSATNADTVDGIHAASFLRSDTIDSVGTDVYHNYGPNSTWSSTLRVGGNGYTAGSNNSFASVVTTNGNLHLDSGGNRGAYLNYYSGTAGIAFGTGSGGVAAWMGSDGDLWKGAADNTGSKYWHAGNDGSGSGLDADTLDGINSGSFARLDAASSYTNFANNQEFYSNTNMATASGNQASLEAFCSGAGNDAFMTFHVGGDFACYFGLDGGTNKLSVGGWSMGAVSYPIYHAGNKPTFAELGITSANINALGINATSVDGIDGTYMNRGTNVYGVFPGSSGHNLNDVFTSYNRAGFVDAWSGSNFPPGTSHIQGIQVRHNASTHYGWQLFGQYNQAGKLYHRQVSNNSWGSWSTMWSSQNDGSGSGLDADLLDGLNVHNTQGTQNGANTILRTQVNGYSMLGWINTTSGDAGSAVPSRFYCNNASSGDAYIRYVDLASKRSLMNVSAKGGYNGREQSTSDTNYWVGSMGWGATNFDTLFDYGSGFIDGWSNPANQPSGTSHWVGFNALHYTNGSTRYGWQMVMGAGNNSLLYVKGKWNSTGSWSKVWNDSNDGSGSGLDADLLDGFNSGESGGSIILRTASNGYIQTQNWRNVGNAGAYSTTANGFHFYPNTGFTYGTARINGVRNGYSGIVMDGGGDVVTGMFDASGNGGDYNTSSGWHYYYHRSNTCLGINSSSTSSSYGAYVNGAIYATGDIVGSSDVRLKKNINTIEDGLAKVEKLRGVTYEWKDSEESGSDGNNITPERMGVIAQEIMDIVPEVVTHDKENDRYGVDYGHLTGLLIEAVKELSDKVKQLEKKLEEK